MVIINWYLLGMSLNLGKGWNFYMVAIGRLSVMKVIFIIMSRVKQLGSVNLIQSMYLKAIFSEVSTYKDKEIKHWNMLNSISKR